MKIKYLQAKHNYAIINMSVNKGQINRKSTVGARWEDDY